MSFKYEYFCKIDFLLETNLGYKSGDRVGSFDEKTTGKKSHASVPLSGSLFAEILLLFCSSML
jgi:hypothetical protein